MRFFYFYQQIIFPGWTLTKLGFDSAVGDFALRYKHNVFQGTAISKDAGKDIVALPDKSKKDRDTVFCHKRENDKVYIRNGGQIYFYLNKVKETFESHEIGPVKPLTNLWIDIQWNGIASEGGVTLKNGKKQGTDEYACRAVHLIETFNYLIGLRIVHIAAPQEFTAQFKRIEGPEVPKGQKTKLVLDGKLQQIKNHHSKSEDPVWWFRKVEGWVPADPANLNNGQKEKDLMVWRKLTGDLEQDNLMLDEWFQKNRISTRDFEFDTIYVNGSNNLPNLKLDNENWKVRLIEEEFMKRMWEVEG